MATPADQRLLELLGKWLASLELHSKYCSLDADSYSQVQPWPEHQRPSRWIIDLARQKALALKAQVEERIGAGDARFAEALELMAFLANLVGSEHIERFIPLAEAANERPPAAKSTAPKSATAEPPADAATGTREMPRFSPATRDAAPVSTAQVTRTERKNSGPVPAGAPPLKAAPLKAQAAPSPAYGRDGPTAEAREQVIADAARLVQWGRKWYELAELIASMADRPHLTDVRRILKDNKSVIDERAGRT